MNINDSKRIEKVPWTIFDILGIEFGTLASTMIFYLILLSFWEGNKITFTFARYVGAIIFIFCPIFWIKKRYNLSKEALGLRRGDRGILYYASVGIITAIIFVFLFKLTPLGKNPGNYNVKGSVTFLHFILFPISVSGFVHVVLVPIAEETMDRGFLYGYLRGKIGIVTGLFLQAVIFSLMHFGYVLGEATSSIVSRFLMGLILGILYEKTGNLYASIFCHGALNYLFTICIILKI